MRKSLKDKIAGKKWDKALNRWANKAAGKMREEIDKEILAAILKEMKEKQDA
jgi:hypothetical protein